MMMCRKLLLALLLEAIALTAVAAGHYTVFVDPDHPRNIEAALRVVGLAQDVPHKLVVRGAAWGLASQVVEPRCNGRLLAAVGDATWSLPGNCNEVRWRIEAREVMDGETDVSQQATIAFAGRRLWLISEPTSLLRVEGDTAPSSLAIETRGTSLTQAGATLLADGFWRVPALNKAPEFYVVGDFTLRTRRIGPLLVRYVADEPSRVAKLGLENEHERALRYLASVLPPDPALPDNERMLLVIWIGIDAARSHSAGAAGSRSFLANYTVGPSTNATDRARMRATLAHEQFHQLVDMARGDRPALPGWFNESIATYYGLRALDQGGMDAPTARFVAGFVSPSREVTSGLLSLQARHDTGDASVYPLFYTQGATFWFELDQALQRNGAPGLDALVPQLIAGTFAVNGDLPPPFLERIRGHLGTKADALLERYLYR